MSLNNEFSTYNREIIANYSKQLWEGVGSIEIQVDQNSVSNVFHTCMSYLYSLLPGTKTVGETTGMALVKAHGADLNRGVISLAYRNVVGTHLGSGAVIEGMNLAVSPYMLPLLERAGIAVGGLTVPAAIWLCSFLYDRAFSCQERTYTIFDAPEIDKLLTKDDNGTIRDALGNALGPQDIKFIQKTIARMNVVADLMNADRDHLDSFLEKFMSLRSDNFDLYYRDGTKVSKEDIQVIEKAYDTLKSNSNIQRKSKYIHKMINRLAKHTLFPESNPPLQMGYIRYEDGKISDPSELIVSQEDYERDVADSDAKLLESFVMVDPDSIV